MCEFSLFKESDTSEHHQVVYQEHDESTSTEVHVQIETTEEYLEGLDDNIRKAVELIRNGTHLHKAAKISDVQFKELEVVVKELKNRGDLRIDSCRKVRPGYGTPEDRTDGKKGRQFIDWNYTAEDVQVM